MCGKAIKRGEWLLHRSQRVAVPNYHCRPVSSISSRSGYIVLDEIDLAQFSAVMRGWPGVAGGDGIIVEMPTGASWSPDRITEGIAQFFSMGIVETFFGANQHKIIWKARNSNRAIVLYYLSVRQGCFSECSCSWFVYRSLRGKFQDRKSRLKPLIKRDEKIIRKW